MNRPWNSDGKWGNLKAADDVANDSLFFLPFYLIQPLSFIATARPNTDSGRLEKDFLFEGYAARSAESISRLFEQQEPTPT